MWRLLSCIQATGKYEVSTSAKAQATPLAGDTKWPAVAITHQSSDGTNSHAAAARLTLSDWST